MAIPPSDLGSHISGVGAAGGGEGEGPPLEGAGVNNTGEMMATGGGQIIDHHDDDEPEGCMERCLRCVRWLREALSEAAAEVETSGETQPLTSGGAQADESGKTEKAKKPKIPKPDTPGKPVDLKTLEYDSLNKWPLDKAIKTATDALENARQTSCYEYWDYKEQPKPSRDRTKVDEAQRILMQAVGLVRSFIAQKTETATPITVEELVPLGELATECEIMHQQIEKKLGDPDDADTEEAEKEDTSSVGGACGDGLGAEAPEEAPPAEDGGGDDSPAEESEHED